MSRHRCEAESPKRQAVVLIHGIGNQRPMATLRKFVRAVWTSNPDIKMHDDSRDVVWSKPDLISDSFELRRLTTDFDKNCTRTDFFEFYWAHLMVGTQATHVFWWAKRLLWRLQRNVPRPLLATYRLLWFLILLSLTIAGALWFLGHEEERAAGAAISFTLLVLAFSVLREGLINPVIGDAARYLSPSPVNVGVRQKIRAAGVDMLQELHDVTDSEGQPKYDRVIVVGHSLGSVIGYDILTHFWHQLHRGHDHSTCPSSDSVEAMERLAREIEKNSPDSTDLGHNRPTWGKPSPELAELAAQYRSLQRRYFRDLQESGNTWRVTDFVTLGSPLTYADLILAEGPEELRSLQESRELPTCPPTLEEPVGEPGSKRFTYQPLPTGNEDPYQDQRRLPHFAACFAPVRWVNLYFPAKWVFFGDLIGGPLGGAFGYGIEDVALKKNRATRFLSHTKYWLVPPETDRPQGAQGDTHIDALWKALGLSPGDHEQASGPCGPSSA